MKKIVTLLLLFFICYTTYSQNGSDTGIEKRSFKDDLNKKYNGSDFTYTEEKKKKQPNINPKDLSGIKSFFSVLGDLLPYLLGILIVGIIVWGYLGGDKNLFKFKKKTSSIKSKKLVYDEEEDINETDFEKLLQLAISNKDYRLATRYFYLATLQKLTKNKKIEYHKDKTNTEYMFELEESYQEQFSYISYLYNYVWYGEFPVDATKFSTIQKSFTSFIKSI